MARQNPKTPHESGPFQAALIGAGFFIFLSALFGSPFLSLGEPEPSASPAPALLVKGSAAALGSPSAKRLRLAEDLMQLRKAGAAVIVLEAWVDEASQQESAEMLQDILEEAGKLKLKGKAGQQVAQSLSSFKERLVADEKLAAALKWCGNVVLPALVEESAPKGLTRFSATWDKAAYKVTRKGKGLQRLPRAWRPLRTPLKGLREAALSLGAVLPSQPGVEIPVIFQIRDSWVNGLGLEALRAYTGVPHAGMKFVWRGDKLAMADLKGRRLPLSPAGSLFPSRRHLVPELSLKEAQDPRLIRGKVAFFQPWPETLAHAGGFERQREAFASLFEGNNDSAPPSHGELWLWAALAALAGAWMAFAPAWLKPLGMALGLFIAWQDSSRHARPWLRPAAAIGGLSLSGAGLAWARRARAGALAAAALAGASAPAHARAWKERLGQGDSGFGGACLMVQDSPEASTAAAVEAEAEAAGFLAAELTAGRFALLLPSPGLPRPLLRSLRSRLPRARLALAFGNVHAAQAAFLGATRWKLGGPAVEKAEALMDLAGEGECLIGEEDYPPFRDQIRIQILSRKGQKALNILSMG